MKPIYIILIIIILAVFGVGVCLLWPKETNIKWTTYQNREPKFKIQYPSDFSAYELENVVEFIKFDYKNRKYASNIRIQFLYNEGGLTAEEWFDTKEEANKYRRNGVIPPITKCFYKNI